MSKQTIFRVSNRQKPFAQISNEMLRDQRLTYEARGVLAFILTLPPDWEFNIPWLLKQGNLGRDRALKIIKLLTDTGYCTKVRNRNKDGTLAQNEFIFSDEAPLPSPEIQGVDQATPWKPVHGEPSTGFQGVATNKETTKTDNKKVAFSPVKVAKKSEKITPVVKPAKKDVGPGYWSTALSPPPDPETTPHVGVTLADGKIKLHNGTKAHWLERFDGDANRLELALEQAAGWIQPSSGRPLEAQVGSQLARQLADKIDRDNRYKNVKQSPVVSKAREIVNRRIAEGAKK